MSLCHFCPSVTGSSLSAGSSSLALELLPGFCVLCRVVSSWSCPGENPWGALHWRGRDLLAHFLLFFGDSHNAFNIGVNLGVHIPLVNKPGSFQESWEGRKCGNATQRTSCLLCSIVLFTYLLPKRKKKNPYFYFARSCRGV